MRALLIAIILVCGSRALARAAEAVDLEPLFARAERDPAAVVPLIEAGSAALCELPSDQAIPLADRLTPFCRRAYLSPERLPGMERLGIGTHLVEPKETVSGLARRFRIGAGMIARLNRTATLRVGKPVKLVDAATESVALVVNRHRFRLLAWRGRTLVGSFRVSVGKPGHETPLGDTTIAARVPDPEWTDPDSGRVFAPKDPGNVLGGFWLGFDPLANKSFHGIGIHGFTAEAPESWLEQRSSHGCVRLAQDDIATVFDLTLPGCRVSVRE